MRNYFSKAFFSLSLLVAPAFVCNISQAATTAQTLAQQQEAAKEAAAKAAAAAAAAKAAAAKAAATTAKTTATNAAVATTVTATKPTVVVDKPTTTTSVTNPLKPATIVVSKSVTPLPMTRAEKSINQTGSSGGPTDSSGYLTGSPTSSQQ